MAGVSKFRSARIAIIGGIIIIVMIAHWRVPVEANYWHAVHLILRKSLFIPVVLAAIWYNLPGALAAAASVTLLYLPHVYLQWQGQIMENMNQVGDLATVWIAALVAGAVVGREKDMLSDLAATHEGALVALVNALDAREHDTQLHSLRVRAYAIRLGHQLGMNDDELLLLGEAALLHDVGKIGVPDRILSKPDALDDDEWTLMREHPSIGRRILENVDFLKESADIVYSHHEKYDGSGYPRGLRGDKIPIGARVFAVVDAFDALMSDRPYQRGVAFDQAKQRILDGNGGHFDPLVVAAFSSISEGEWQEIAKRVESYEPVQDATP